MKKNPDTDNAGRLAFLTTQAIGRAAALLRCIDEAADQNEGVVPDDLEAAWLEAQAGLGQDADGLASLHRALPDIAAHYKAQEAALAKRRQSLDTAAGHVKAALLAVAQANGGEVETEHFRVAETPGRYVVVVGEDALLMDWPAALVRVADPVPDKAALMKVAKSGGALPDGASLAKGDPSVRVTVK